MSESPDPVRIRVADARFLASGSPRRVRLLGRLDGWKEALEAGGLSVVDGDADLAVATRAEAGAAAVLGVPAVVVLGEGRRHLRRAGYATRTYLVRSGAAGPRLYLPVDAPHAAKHALLSRIPGRPLAKRLAVRATLTAASAGIPLRGVVTVGSKQPGHAGIVGATVAATDDSYLVTGEGDDLQRLVWFCFGDRAEPRWVVKFSRVPGYAAPFEREERSFAALDILPPQLRQRAPTLAQSLTVDGLAVAVESAAAGVPLNVCLEDGRPRPVVAAVAEWIVGLGTATRLTPSELEPELERLRAFAGEVARGLPELPAVLQHNDLGCWNVLAQGSDFTVVDWESARRAGLPLWDLVYFLTDALTAGPGADKDTRVAALLRGHSPQSELLFESLRSAAVEFGIPLEAVGRIVTLAWLHHGASAGRRVSAGSEHGAHTGAPSETGPLQRVARYWPADPELGVEWSPFATFCARSRISTRTSSDR